MAYSTILFNMVSVLNMSRAYKHRHNSRGWMFKRGAYRLNPVLLRRNVTTSTVAVIESATVVIPSPTESSHYVQ